jgi:hypothetical protein
MHPIPFLLLTLITQTIQMNINQKLIQPLLNAPIYTERLVRDEKQIRRDAERTETRDREVLVRVMEGVVGRWEGLYYVQVRTIEREYSKNRIEQGLGIQ